SDKQRELDKLTHELSDRSMVAETRQVELAAVNAQVEALKQRVGDAEREFGATQQKLVEQRGNSDTAIRDLSEARSRAESLTQHADEL
ncbi:hypothetical protein, partial [Klebsiella pneumoniae]|uniref:hypothetical protein n=1 Tax=Klebsiella pneumoniae TaxID=573 RepID=UPI001907DEAE